jgi:hypothetical protein
MLKHSSYLPYLSTAILLCAMMASPFASAKCGCPADGHGAPTLPITPIAGTAGLGDAFPATVDVAPDPAWQVYEFARDGVRYVQVNDKAGRVRAAVGRIDDTFWVLPIGADVDRVSIAPAVLSARTGTVVYRSKDLEVVLVRSGSQDRWLIRQPGGTQ